MDVAFLITTCNRPVSCQRLVDALAGLGDIFVMNDGCNYKINGAKQFFIRERQGRDRWWYVVNWLFTVRTSHKYYIMLPDDFMPAYDMVNRAIKLWESIKDDNKICLNLYADRIGLQCWTTFEPIDKGNVTLTQWVDMCFICTDRFFSVVGKIPDLSKMYGGTSTGSGVGRYISKTLYKLGHNLYQVKVSLVTPQKEHDKSEMHNDNSRNRHTSRKRRFF